MTEEIPVDKLEPHPYNQEILPVIEPSERFVGDIAKKGIENPLVVVPSDDDSYLILDGKQRWRASKELDMDEVPCDVREYETKEEEETAALLLNDYQDEIFSRKMKVALEYEEKLAPHFEKSMKEGTPLHEIYSLEEEEEMGGAGGQHVLSILTEGPPTEESEKENTRRAYTADRVGWSPTKLWQAKQVWMAKSGDIDIDDPDIVSRLQTQAEKLIEQLDAGDETVYGAYQQVEIWRGRLQNGYPVQWVNVADALPWLFPFEIEEQYEDDISGFNGDSWEEGLKAVAQPYLDGDETFIQKAHVATYLLESDDRFDLEGITRPGFVERRPDKETLNDLYWEEDLDIYDMSIRLGVAPRLIQYWMKELNIPLKFDHFTDGGKDRLLQNGLAPASFDKGGLSSPDESDFLDGEQVAADGAGEPEAEENTDEGQDITEPTEGDATDW